MFFVPILTILTILIAGRSAAFAGFVAIFTTIIAALTLNPDLRKKPMLLLDGLVSGGINAVRILVVIGTIGIFVGVINSTGLGVKLAQLISGLGQENLFLSLVVAALATAVLSMGMPTAPAYLIVVLTMGPALIALETPVLSLHLFILYYAALGAVTPPVAGGSYTAAPIAEADPLQLSYTAFRLTIVAYIFPFVFIYSPEIFLVVGDPSLPEIVAVIVRSLIAVILITFGLGVAVNRGVGLLLKAITFGTGCLMLVPSLIWFAIGLAIGLPAAFFLRNHAAGNDGDAPA